MKANIIDPITCFLCKKKGHKASECRQKRWCVNIKLKTHNNKFCRKKSYKNSVNKVNLVEKEETKVPEEKTDLFFKAGVDPIMIIYNEGINLLVDCGATTHNK